MGSTSTSDDDDSSLVFSSVLNLLVLNDGVLWKFMNPSDKVGRG